MMLKNGLNLEKEKMSDKFNEKLFDTSSYYFTELSKMITYKQLEDLMEFDDSGDRYVFATEFYLTDEYGQRSICEGYINADNKEHAERKAKERLLSEKVLMIVIDSWDLKNEN
jgi:hypothetical protein